MTTDLSSFRERLKSLGLSVPEWAQQHGFPVRAVRAVLYGQHLGRRGQSAKIANELRQMVERD